MRQKVGEWRAQGDSISFIPTMGALHEGHLALVRQGQQAATRTVVGIFVNPTQFGPDEDFATYPRTLKDDCRQLDELGVDAVFAPNAAEMYPDGFETFVINERMANLLCGSFREGHFRGVLTVVSKLFHIVQPDVALFGKKDYQQFQLIRRMVRDLDWPIRLVGGETVRESDGLAMSSRNRNLTPQQRQAAPALYAGLQKAQSEFAKGERDPQQLRHIFESELPTNIFELQYVEIRDQDSLEAISGPIERPAVMAIAAFLGTVRLIDNVELG
jgi:pantoate--beta-alanine ligase